MTDETRIKAGVERIFADLNACVQAVETMRPIVFEDKILAKFNGTYSAHVVTSLQDILRDHAIMTLCRMWDTDGDAHSILSVIESLPQQDSGKASHRKYDQVGRIVRKMSASGRLMRLRNWRNKYLGHALAKTRAEENKEIHPPTWDEIFVLYRRSGVIAEAIAVVAASLSFDRAEIQDLSARNAKAFWGSFIDKPH
ncbi:MAG: hypothetical protein COW30_18850 [Rhodospirillales bacterium CG15_BIG_FIL_POST_REV_8_21_14_020_66_15]|nr:MAG: hypothetical protein COW30_18850 [Rhodospirillales bacterium CG15_BIG_FIL_POST_REV_8_21_14_020_66_15]